MTINQFIRALKTNKIELTSDGVEYRDCDGDCPIIALYNFENPTACLENSDAEYAGRELGLQADDVGDIMEMADGVEPNDFIMDDEYPKVRLQQRRKIRKAFHAMAV